MENFCFSIDEERYDDRHGHVLSLDGWYAPVSYTHLYVGGTEANFVDMMNQKAKELGCTHTHFVNASGLPDENHYTSALDLAKIMKAGLKNARFRKVIESVGYTIPATNLSEARPMHTHMPLMAKESDLYYEGCIGGKTGFANEAPVSYTHLITRKISRITERPVTAVLSVRWELLKYPAVNQGLPWLWSRQ